MFLIDPHGPVRPVHLFGNRQRTCIVWECNLQGGQQQIMLVKKLTQGTVLYMTEYMHYTSYFLFLQLLFVFNERQPFFGAIQESVFNCVNCELSGGNSKLSDVRNDG